MAAIRVRLAALLHSYTGGLKFVDVEASTLGESITVLDRRFPGLGFRVVDEQGHIRQHMNIFIGEENVRDLDAVLKDGDEIYIVGALSGG